VVERVFPAGGEGEESSMNFLELRPCEALLFPIGKPSPRLSGNGYRTSYVHIADHHLRTARFKPFQLRHDGPTVGVVLFCRIKHNHVFAYGLCERRFLNGNAIVSVGVNSIDYVFDTEGIAYPSLIKILHVAIYTDAIGSYDTFLRRWAA
jgi:hypothetical protein